MKRSFGFYVVALLGGLSLLALLMAPNLAEAYSPFRGGGGGGGGGGAGPSLDIREVNDVNTKVLCPIFSAMFNILFVTSIIVVVYASYLYLFSGGDTEKVKKATQTLTYAAVAILVAMIAKAFPIIVSTFVSATNPLTEVC